MKTAIYPVSFDPITIGHLDIIRRSARIFDKVVIAILVNTRKTPCFDNEKRKEMIEKCISDLDNVEVVIKSGLTIDVAKEYDAKVLIRGIRAVADYEYELQQATANMTLANDIETLFMVAKPEYSFLSSSVVKEMAYYHADLSKVLPKEIIDEVQDKFK